MNERDPIRLDAALRQARERVDATDAETLLIHVLGRDRAWLFAHATDAMPSEALQRYESLLSRRAQGEPVAYLLGRRAFWTLQLETTPAVLIPRPETELLVEEAVARIAVDHQARVADLGTGSGAIALSIAVERPQARVVATDVSHEALAVARTNADTHDIRNVEFRQGDWLSPLAGERFDLIASNPPYIAADDPHLRQGDLRFEPPGALASGSDGLDAIRSIVRDSPAHLEAGGWLLLEHGWEQGEAVRDLLQAAGFGEVAAVRDLEGRDRVTLGRRAL